MSKINANSINGYDSINQTRGAEGRKTTKETAIENKQPVSTEDKIELSGKASRIGELVDRLKELPDVRADKVSALKAKIEANEYNPTSDAIADAILKSEKP
jgi:negative regulator of flagellin synthesis FlgM